MRLRVRVCVCVRPEPFCPGEKQCKLRATERLEHAPSPRLPTPLKPRPHIERDSRTRNI